MHADLSDRLRPAVPLLGLDRDHVPAGRDIGAMQLKAGDARCPAPRRTHRCRACRGLDVDHRAECAITRDPNNVGSSLAGDGDRRQRAVGHLAHVGARRVRVATAPIGVAVDHRLAVGREVEAERIRVAGEARWRIQRSLVGRGPVCLPRLEPREGRLLPGTLRAATIVPWSAAATALYFSVSPLTLTRARRSDLLRPVERRDPDLAVVDIGDRTRPGGRRRQDDAKGEQEQDEGGPHSRN